MKSIYTRFLAIVVVIVMTFGCTMVAHADDGNPYQSSYYDVPCFGVIASLEAPVLTEPSEDAEQLGILNAGTVCRIFGKYDNNGYGFSIIDLTILDGYDAEYGFVRSLNINERASWVILTNPTNANTTPWTNGLRSFTGLTGLAMVLQEDERYYAVQHVDHFGITSFIPKKRVKPYSQEGQELCLLPIDTPVYGDSKNQIGELPGLTVIELTNMTEGNYISITANPGTDDELSGWIIRQSFMEIIN